MRLDVPTSSLVLALTLFVAAPLAAQEGAAPEPTPREAFDAVVTQFSQGHAFQPEETSGFAELRARLVASGDDDLASDLDLLEWAVTAQGTTAETQAQAELSLPEDFQAWKDRETLVRDRAFWKGVRDFGLTTFTFSTVATLLLAATMDRDEALMRNSFFNDWESREKFRSLLGMTMAGTATTVFLSLFPLLWGEARQ